MDKNITIRKANREDAKSIWLIRNSPLARRSSPTTKKINFTSHKTWFKNKYFNQYQNYCFVMEKNKTVSGYCRFDFKNNQHWVSIAIKPGYQGKGLGSVLLNQALKKINKSKEILAEVKFDNESSIKIFLKNKFEIYRQDNKFFYLKHDKYQNTFKKKCIELCFLLLRQKLSKSDAIIWLQGDRYDRAEKPLELYRKGWAPKIIITGNNNLIGKSKRIEEENISIERMVGWLKRHSVVESNIIVDRESLNTKDQAAFVINLAKTEKWKKIILVGSSYYQPRAFLTFLKQAEQLNWRGEIINAPATIEWQKIPSGRKKFTWQRFNEEIKKIKKYKKDIISINTGIDYLKNH